MNEGEEEKKSLTCIDDLYAKVTEHVRYERAKCVCVVD